MHASSCRYVKFRDLACKFLAQISLPAWTWTSVRRLTDEEIRQWLQSLQSYQFFRLEDLMNQVRPPSPRARREECSTCHHRLCTRKSPCNEHLGRCSCHVCYKWWKKNVKPFKGYGKGDKDVGALPEPMVSEGVSPLEASLLG